MVQGEPKETVQGLLSVRQAIDVLDKVDVAPRIERRALLDAQGYRLAQEVRADRDYPPFDKSLMDGYAVRSADVIGKPPVELAVVGAVPAGSVPTRAIGPGEAMAVMTGAPLPEGADGVAPIEDVQVVAGDADAAGFVNEGRIRIMRAASPRRFVSARGSERVADDPVLRRGAQLGAAQIAAAASVGVAHLEVYAKPRVAVLGTGDEIVPIDQTPGPAQIRNSNNVMLLALLKRLGCQATDLGVVADDPAAIRERLVEGMRHDALLVTGGMSMGAHDHVPRLLAELGVDLKITKLRIKPGKPFVFGVRSSAEHSAPSATYVFGLPGNPVSAFVCTIRLASRLLARMAGSTPEERWVMGRTDVGLPANGPREFYQPVIRTVAAGGKSAQAEFATITPLAWKGSADVFTLASANALLVRAENDPPLPKGTIVRVLEF